KGGADKLVIAHAKIGQILFEQSCPVKPVNGSCVKISRERAIVTKKPVKKKKGKEVYVAPTKCAQDDSHINLTVVKRDDRKVREALQEYAAAAKEFAKVNGQDETALSARYYMAMGKMAEADV